MRKGKFRKNRSVFIVILVFVLIVTVSIYEMVINNEENNFFDLIIIIATVAGASAVWYEFKKTKRLNEAVFITSLNTDFINTEIITEIYSVLYISRENGNYESYINNRNVTDDKVRYLDKKDIVKFNSYLNFFEVIYVLIQKKFIDFEIINELFSHRFFLVCNDPVVQDMKLVKKKKHYQNIYELHKMWKNYRLKNDKEIYYEETCLSKFYE